MHIWWDCRRNMKLISRSASRPASCPSKWSENKGQVSRAYCTLHFDVQKAINTVFGLDLIVSSCCLPSCCFVNWRVNCVQYLLYSKSNYPPFKSAYTSMMYRGYLFCCTPGSVQCFDHTDHPRKCSPVSLLAVLPITHMDDSHNFYLRFVLLTFNCTVSQTSAWTRNDRAPSYNNANIL